MSFWKSLPGAVLVVVLVGAVVGTCALGYEVQRVTHPPRPAEAAANLGVELAKAEEIAFSATDGVALNGWLLTGAAGKPAIVLCHDYGATKNALINVAIVLNQAGFTVLAFDFRAHGASGGTLTTLGIDEARDVLAAVDFVARLAPKGIDTRRIGAYGTGMGAHAIVLAAAERPALRVLVLDGLWPDAGWPLAHRVFEDWPFCIKHCAGLAKTAFAVVAGTQVGEHRAADALRGLAGRDVLLVAPAGDGKLEAAMKTMYDGLPERRDSERGLLTRPATEGSGMSASDLARYHARVVEFFASRLAPR